jgi:hypothetical protein
MSWLDKQFKNWIASVGEAGMIAVLDEKRKSDFETNSEWQ